MITIEKEYMKCNICGNIFDAQDLVSVDELGVHLISGWVTPCCESFDYDEVDEPPKFDYGRAIKICAEMTNGEQI